MIAPIAETPAVFAESPVWLAGPQRLFWVDCVAGRLLSLDWRTRAVTTLLSLPGTLFAGLARRDDLSLLLFTGRGAFIVDSDGQTEPFSLPAAIDPGLFNDAKVDRAGRLWVGQVQSEPGLGDGKLVRVAGAEADTVVADLGIPNGPAFSLDGSIACFSDSLAATIETLALGTSRRRLLAVPPGAGQPDGMTVDAEGRLIVAIFGGGALSRIDPETAFVERIQIPVRQPTSCAFGGPDLKTLFVTVANGRWPQDRRYPGPPPAMDHALPSLYAVSMNVPGMREPDLTAGEAITGVSA
jgi:sugar lactone lactonase YvrE